MPRNHILDDVGKLNVTGSRRQSCTPMESDREMRCKTSEASAQAQEKQGPRCRAGTMKKGRETKRSLKAQATLCRLYDIGVDDKEQPSGRMSFLVDQRQERNERLPPVTAMTGIEKRRKEREEKEEKRRQRELQEKATRFETVGESISK